MARGCHTCGTLNPDRAPTCEYCGASLPATPPYRDPFVQRRGGTPHATGYAAPPRAKDPSVGLLIELLPGFFGFLGIGYLWAGETLLGVVLLLGYWAFWTVVAVASIATFGLLLCFLPFFIVSYFAAPIVSALLLQRRLRARQSLGVGPAVVSPPHPY